ncbi:MAG: hypothetical protein Q8O30_00690, partial [Candidatus Omnitrophota bacterium]|nr:hypothetical protein [Candidatus Omnitrophota bacterium]
MIKKTIYLLFTFSFLLSIITPAAFSYQFRDYTWGMPQKAVKERLVEEGREITEERNVLYYKDKLFNIDCRVVFLFTLTGHALCGIDLIWNNTDVGPKLKEELTKKYGEPVKLNAYTEEYTWTGPSEYEYDNLSLDYNYGDTRLQYY